MPRRGENIYKRKDGRWEGRYIKYHTADRKAKYGYVYASTYKDVKEKLQCTLNRNMSIPQKGAADTYAELLCRWLHSKQLTVKESTYYRYKRIVDVYLLPEFGALAVSEIDTVSIEHFAAILLSSGRKDHTGGLSPKSVSDILVILKSTMLYGRKSGYAVNCCEKGISIKKTDSEMRVLSPEEQSILSTYLRTDTDLYKFGVLLSLYTGIRIGELCALRWRNIRMDRCSIKIDETLQRIPVSGGHLRTRIVITKPKSTCSIREIPLPEFMLPLIKKFEADPMTYVLTGDIGRFAEPRTMQYHFKKYITKCDIAPANFHSLRHTFATRCVEAGFEIKSLSEILGHSSVNITLNKYVHSSFELKAQNMKKLSF